MQLTDCAAAFSPGNYLQRFDLERKLACFRQVAAAELSRAAFLDDRLETASFATATLPIDRLLACRLPDSRSRTRLIFHTAYCCSTLLARLLDIPGTTTVYREPVTLHQLAVLKRRAHEFEQLYSTCFAPLLQLSLGKLFTPWGDGMPVIVKLTDSSNNIAEDILGRDAAARAILLYSGMIDFVVSNLKLAGRRKFLGLFGVRAGRDAACLGILQNIDINRLADAQRAIYVWLVQVEWYRRIVTRFPAQVRLVNSATLIGAPDRTIPLVIDQLALGGIEKITDRVLASRDWRSHAKDINRANFGATDREGEKHRVLESCSGEIAQALAWFQELDLGPVAGFLPQLESATGGQGESLPGGLQP